MSSTKSYYIQTFGCQMNERDSETIAGMLVRLGYEESEERDDADVIIINTCSVREHADERFFGTLGQLKKVKERRPDVIVSLCGCMMEQQHIIDRIKGKFPWVDLIFGTRNIHEFPLLLSEVKSGVERGTIFDIVADQSEGIVEGLPQKRKYPFKSFVNIMYGCNNYCTYCIVPYTRGRERSRAPEEIIREVKELVSDGVKEVTLLGQNVNSYSGLVGADDLRWKDEDGEVTWTAGEAIDFPMLLHALDSIDGLERIRFMTSHPKDLSLELIAAFAELEKLPPHIHLPVQAGSDAVLERMNRHYTAEHYLELVGALREARPDIAITTDIIVGFPGEGDDDFEKTLALCQAAEFDSAFTFMYSVRKGTPAAKFDDQIPEEVKHERFERLVEAVNDSAAKKNAALVGSIQDVLIEGASKHGKEGMVSGRTGGFKLVDFDGQGHVAGEIVPVRITSGKTFSLRGEIESL